MHWSIFYDSVNLQSHKTLLANFTNKINSQATWSKCEIYFRFWLKFCNPKGRKIVKQRLCNTFFAIENNWKLIIFLMFAADAKKRVGEDPLVSCHKTSISVYLKLYINMNFMACKVLHVYKVKRWRRKSGASSAIKPENFNLSLSFFTLPNRFVGFLSLLIWLPMLSSSWLSHLFLSFLLLLNVLCFICAICRARERERNRKLSTEN